MTAPRCGASPHGRPGTVPVYCRDVMCVHNDGEGRCADPLLWVSTRRPACTGHIHGDYSHIWPSALGGG